MQELKVIQFRPAEDIHRKYKVTSVLSDEPFLIFYTEHSWIERLGQLLHSHCIGLITIIPFTAIEHIISTKPIQIWQNLFYQSVQKESFYKNIGTR